MACKPDLEELTVEPDVCIQSGNKSRGYFAYASDVLTWPTEPTSTVLGDNITYTDVFVMKTGAKFWEFHSTMDGIIYAFEKLSNGIRNTVTIDRDGLEDKILGLLDKSNKKDYVFIVEDNNGKLRVLGQDGRAARITAFEGTTGGTIEDDTNTLITVTSDGPIARIYTGAIPVTPAP